MNGFRDWHKSLPSRILHYPAQFSLRQRANHGIRKQPVISLKIQDRPLRCLAVIDPHVVARIPQIGLGVWRPGEVDEIGEKVVRANLYVETESQKGILVGKRGAMVRDPSTGGIFIRP